MLTTLLLRLAMGDTWVEARSPAIIQALPVCGGYACHPMLDIHRKALQALQAPTLGLRLLVVVVVTQLAPVGEVAPFIMAPVHLVVVEACLDLHQMMALDYSQASFLNR